MKALVLLLSAAAALSSSAALGQTVAHWKLDGGKDGQAAEGRNSIVDSVGGHHGTPVGKLVYRAVKTPLGEVVGVKFDGSGGRITVPDNEQFAITGSLTVEVCLLLDRHLRPPVTDFRLIVLYGDDRGGLDPYYMGIREDNGKLFFRVQNADNVASDAVSPDPFPEGELIHVAGTLDANTGIQQLFINGRLIASTRTDVRPFGALQKDANPGLGIGARQSGILPFTFNGVITEVRISNVALDPAMFLINTRSPLRRSKDADTVILADGNSIQGEIAIEALVVESAVGPLKLPATQLAGMASQKDGIAKFFLLDGQTVCGKATREDLAIQLKDGTRREIPFHGIKEWSYRVSDARPARINIPPARMVLPSGDELAFEPNEPVFTLHTAIGDVNLRPANLKEIAFKGLEGVRATATNGSTLTGVMDRSRLKFTLSLGPILELGPEKISCMKFNNQAAASSWLARVRLVGGDELVGCIPAQKVKLLTDDGLRELDIVAISGLAVAGGETAEVKCWDGTTRKGKLEPGKIVLAITACFEVSIPTGQIAAITRFVTVPEDQVPKRVEELVGMLGSDKYKDRDQATEELSRMGPAIVDLLRKYHDHDDLEVRQRIDLILRNFEGIEKPGPA
jgi:hypothetical protein